MRSAALAILGCLFTVAVTACGGAPPAPTVATLQITGARPQHVVTLTPKLVRVQAGNEFSVVIDTTDGPSAWQLTTAAQTGIVEGKGSTPVGSCGNPPKAGCALPYRYTFLAKARGTTTMLWTEYMLACPSHASGSCPAVIQPIRVTVS